MSRFPEIALLAVALAIAGCSSLPETAPVDNSAAAPRTAPQAEPAPDAAATSTEQAVPMDSAEQQAAPQPEPVDYNQQFYEQAVAALKQGDTGLAIDLLQTVSHDAPDKPFVFTNLGLAQFQLQHDDLALAAFQQAVERDPRDAVAWNHLGILQRRQGQFDAARQSYQRALEIEPDYALAHLNLGILFDIYLQQLEPALRHYQRYQALLGKENETVASWIVDLERRLKSAS